MIGVLGGTFDPIHYGHLRTALDVQQALGLDELRFIPLANAVHRDQPEVPAALRLTMLEAAIAGELGFVADDRELQRGGRSYTLDTLLSLRGELGDELPICLLLGSDAFNGFLSWHLPELVAELAHLVVMTRPGQALPEDPALQAFLSSRLVDEPEALRRSPGGTVIRLPVTQLEISSTGIRHLIGAGESPRFLLPDEVLRLIERHQIYRN
ncbi:nicotinate-nucleotide adenylyltransferase [endosymbiont of Ridgeia piscesae]|jgi:nicotinate-nucleotide adenylyltransferase|uniref:Probable nicotinate-nucleotide adenylyltransferase n=1 Tax=endosymbiont of Ridgeia piscesae TaxID=54398 RepID=A0A0T5Z4Z5_9GAMM|nr:nicotinate-nucleotide adenylyltransferase [endosymbiont of Ridgeia piscesae]KRT56533.1 nicotinate-nucleotide adenylyltransferase [endosymbiont of Ridgeia piscesae]KRT57959.1 nicotinate-nucleotide adenylyltransferase [endosymbiont of Ridgeia piscesae]